MLHKATGRFFLAPDARLSESVGERSVYTTLQFHREHREKPELLDAVARSDRFARSPGVSGVAPLVEARLASGTLVYDTGPIWPVARLLALSREAGGPTRTRATLELLAAAGDLLDRAAAAAWDHGLSAHGHVGPWRLLLTPTGAPVVIGYGLPPLDLLGDQGKRDVASYRYCPPERLTREPEDLSSDLYALTLVGFEWMLGEPLFHGDTERVRVAAERGLARERLLRFQDQMERAVFEVFDRALRPHPDERFPDGPSYVAAFDDLARSPLVHGPDLAEWLGWIAAHDPQRPATTLLDPAVPEPDRSVAEPRWSRIPRRRSTERTPQVRTGPDRNAMYPTDPLGADAVEVRILLAGAEFHARISPGETLAKSAARLIDALEIATVDLTGRLRGWYRIVQGDQAWFGDAPARVLDLDRSIELEWVPNDGMELIVAVEEASVSVPVGLAVHTGFLVCELCRALALDGNDWTLLVDDRPTDAWQILDDFAPAPGTVLRLTRSAPRRIRRRDG